MGDPIENPDVHWVTILGVHVPIPNKPIGAPRIGGKPLTPSERAQMTPRMTKEKRLVSAKAQEMVARLVGGKVIPDNKEFDVVAGNNVIEVKTLIDAVNDRLSMGTDSRVLKEIYGDNMNHWTIGIDLRAHPATAAGTMAYYLFPGTKGYRLENVIPTPPEVIRDIFRTYYGAK